MFDKKAWTKLNNQKEEVKQKNRESSRRYRANHLEQVRAQNRKWRVEHPEQKQGDVYDHKLWSREHHHLEKVKVTMHYSNPPGIPICNNCGEQDIDVLCVDHIFGEGAKQRRELKTEGIKFYDWLPKNNFPGGYQVLCANCNTKKSKLEH